MRPVILTFVPYYLPGYKAGGPIRTIANMVDQLSDEFAFYIVTADRDMGEKQPFSDVESNVWTDVGRGRVFYRTPGPAGWRTLRATLAEIPVNAIYLNSLFSVSATLGPLFKRSIGQLPQTPVLLAPRGELSPGALRMKSRKKQIFLWLAHKVGLYQGVSFQASSEYELDDIRRMFKRNDINVALDLSKDYDKSLSLQRIGSKDDAVKAVFLSRVSKMKNLLGALEILRCLSCRLEFDIYGVIEDKKYWLACKELIRKLPDNIDVTFRGPVHPSAVEQVLAPYDFLFLPTFGENYGHVIKEALSVGLPALISDRTPWVDLEVRNAGIALPLEEPNRFVKWIEDFARLGVMQRQAMREGAYDYGNDAETASQNREANRRLLWSVVCGQSLSAVAH